MVTTSIRLKLYYEYVVSQPATVRILANDVQVVTAPPYYLWAVKVTTKHREDGSISSAINSGNPNPSKDMEYPGLQHSW